MTTRKKKPQPAKKGRSPQPVRRGRPAAKSEASVKPDPPKPATRGGKKVAANAQPVAVTEAADEDVLPLDVLGDLDEDGTLAALGIAGETAELDSDVTLRDVESVSRESGEEPSEEEAEDEQEPELEADAVEIAAEDEPEADGIGQVEDREGEASDEANDGGLGTETEQAAEPAVDAVADVVDIADFLPQERELPELEDAGAETGEAVAGDLLSGDESANDTENFLKNALEAILFVSDKPLSVKDIAKALQLDRRRAQEILDVLKAEYENKGIRVDGVADGFAFRSHPKVAEYVRAFLEQKPVKLSRAQLETLAIVAYRQPITRPEADDIRGVDCGPVLKGLLDRELVRVIGKKDEPGRPMLYGTTPAFLELFGLQTLEELPTLKEFTELNEDSRRKFETEMGEEAPIGLADFGLSNDDDANQVQGQAQDAEAPAESDPTGAQADVDQVEADLEADSSEDEGEATGGGGGSDGADAKESDEADEADEDDDDDDDDEDEDEDDEADDDDDEADGDKAEKSEEDGESSAENPAQKGDDQETDEPEGDDDK